MKTNTLLAGGFGLLCFTSIAAAVDLIPFESDWAYMHPTNNVNPNIADTDFDTTWLLGTADFTLNYNGPAFGSAPALTGPPFDSGTGPAPIGYDVVDYIRDNYPANAANNGFATLLTRPASGSRRTAYFRHQFAVASAVDSLALDIIADDGAAIYLDGVLLKRVNFTAADTWNTSATAAAPEGVLQTFNVALGSLSAGNHVLAVSLHQSSTTSTDLGFDLRLSDEGLSDAPFGSTDFNGTVTEFFLDGAINGWVRNATSGEYLLDGADGGTIMSQRVDLSSKTGVLFSMQVRFDETSVASNFEPADVFSARLELMLPGNIPQTIQLAPFGLDSNQDGVVSGDEILPGDPVTQQLDVRYVFSAVIPDNAVSARVVVEAKNDAGTEMFRFNEVSFTDVRTSFLLGSIEVGPGGDIALLVGPNAWVEDSAKQFSLNDADNNGFGKILASEVIDLNAAIPASASIDLLAADTSTASNFETGDIFAAWVEVVDSLGVGSVIQLVTDGDTNGDHALSGDEFAPGVDSAVLVSASFWLTANLPAGTARAQFFIRAETNAQTETFTISNVVIGALLAEPTEFQIVRISHAAGTSYDIEFESDASTTYVLEFSPDLSAGSFAQVGLPIAGTDGTTTTNHDPGAADAEGFYRIIPTGPIIIVN